MSTFDAVVVAGGASRRMAGVDKVSLEVGGTRLLDRVIAAAAGAGHIICVGPERRTAVPVTWTREEPPGGGPTAALATGLQEVTAPSVVVLAGDMPFVTAAVVDRLVAQRRACDAVLAVDRSGTPQPLLACYETASLRAVLGPDVAGMSLLTAIEGLRVRYLELDDAAFDCDTWEDIAAARRGAN